MATYEAVSIRLAAVTHGAGPDAQITTDKAIRQEVSRIALAADSAAGDTRSVTLLSADEPMTVQFARITANKSAPGAADPETVLTADNTNNKVLTLVKFDASTDTEVTIDSITTSTTDTGDWIAGKAVVFDSVDIGEAETKLDAGDSLRLNITVGGTGVALPATVFEAGVKRD